MVDEGYTPAVDKVIEDTTDKNDSKILLQMLILVRDEVIHIVYTYICTFTYIYYANIQQNDMKNVLLMFVVVTDDRTENITE